MIIWKPQLLFIVHSSSSKKLQREKYKNICHTLKNPRVSKQNKTPQTIFQNVTTFSQSCDTENWTMVFRCHVWQQYALQTFFSTDLRHLIRCFLSTRSAIISCVCLAFSQKITRIINTQTMQHWFSEKKTHRADFHCLTGSLPFAADTSACCNFDYTSTFTKRILQKVILI